MRSPRGLISYLEIGVNACVARPAGRAAHLDRCSTSCRPSAPGAVASPSLLAVAPRFGGCFVLDPRDLVAGTSTAVNGAEDISGLCGTRVGRSPAPRQGTPPQVAESLAGPKSGGRGGLLLRRQHHPRRRLADAEARAAPIGARLRDHAAAQPHRLSQVPRPAPGRERRARLRRAAQGRRAVRAAQERRGSGRAGGQGGTRRARTGARGRTRSAPGQPASRTGRAADAGGPHW